MHPASEFEDALIEDEVRALGHKLRGAFLVEALRRHVAHEQGGTCRRGREQALRVCRGQRLEPDEPVYYQNFATTVYLYRKDAREFYHIGEQQVFDKALDLYRQATAAGGTLALSGVQKRVETMLTMTGAHNFLTMHATEADAVRALGGMA